MSTLWTSWHAGIREVREPETGGVRQEDLVLPHRFSCRDRAARYLFFFGTPSHGLRVEDCDVTAWVAREGDRPYFYERLDTVTAPNVPSLLEVGYQPAAEKFVARYRDGTVVARRVEEIGRQFIEQLVAMHFSSRR